MIPVTHDDSEVLVPSNIRSLGGLIRHNNKRNSQTINILAVVMTLLLIISIVILNLVSQTHSRGSSRFPTGH